ncbi:hypothetical protein Droror1_Dr00005672 [Drosera rotundifolia]
MIEISCTPLLTLSRRPKITYDSRAALPSKLCKDRPKCANTVWLDKKQCWIDQNLRTPRHCLKTNDQKGLCWIEQAPRHCNLSYTLQEGYATKHLDIAKLLRLYSTITKGTENNVFIVQNSSHSLQQHTA